MQVLDVSFLLCFAAVAYGFPELGTQVVGGQNASVGMFPYQVSLRENGSHFCGGSIINSRYILTAAHCVLLLDDPKAISIHAGTILLSSTGDTYKVEKIIAHRSFGTPMLANDIALVRVDRDIEFNNLVKSIPLATGNNHFEGATCTLSGWGSLALEGPTPNNLQYLNLVIDNQSDCSKVHREVIDTHICTFNKYGEGACHGDSGGPLVVNGQQVGIASFGTPCGVGAPDVYTRVTSFISWIQQQQAYIQNGEVGEAPENAIYIL